MTRCDIIRIISFAEESAEPKYCSKKLTSVSKNYSVEFILSI
nr:MAG TPA: hypothetical protein [Caudoviricetes sp.]